VIAGHSAGGQFVQRYALASPITEVAGQHEIHLKFVSGNPSSYVYLDKYRPKLTFEKLSSEKEMLNQHIEWIVPDKKAVPGYNKWKYGLSGECNPYLKETPKKKLKSQYIHRDVVYLIGLEDTKTRPPTTSGADSCDDNDDDGKSGGNDDEGGKKNDETNDKHLDVTPEAMLQGHHRLERAVCYYNHLLKHSDGNSKHKIVFVKGIGHDAAGMFGSPEGRNALFS